MDIAKILDAIAEVMVILTVIGLGAVGVYFAYKAEKQKKKTP